jgi:hypothetical protein
MYIRYLFLAVHQPSNLALVRHHLQDSKGTTVKPGKLDNIQWVARRFWKGSGSLCGMFSVECRTTQLSTLESSKL